MLLERPYNREHAVAYAKKWALSRNPLFGDFSDLGGNCTNFVSQCLLAGCCCMNFKKVYGWYYLSVEDRAPAWTGVDALYKFLTRDREFEEKNGGIGPYAKISDLDSLEEGDIIQLANADGEWYHSVIVTGFSPEAILVSAQTIDSLDRPLTTYRYASLRALRILGAKIELSDGGCFDTLMDG